MHRGRLCDNGRTGRTGGENRANGSLSLIKGLAKAGEGGVQEASQGSQAVPPEILCCLEEEQRKARGSVCPRSGVSPVRAPEDAVPTPETGTHGLCCHWLHEFYIWKCINYWWDVFFFSHLDINSMHSSSLYPLKKRTRAPQSFHSPHTPLGATYTMKWCHSRTLKGMSLTCERKRQMSSLQGDLKGNGEGAESPSPTPSVCCQSA